MTAYCDRATNETFEILCGQFFQTVERVTGCGFLKLHALLPDDPHARLRAIIVDGEIAQVNGLARTLVKYVAAHVPSESGVVVPKEPIEIVMLVLKFCHIHFDRSGPSIFDVNMNTDHDQT